MTTPLPKPAAITVRLSTQGRLVVPKEVRLRHGWSAGAELALEDLGDRVVLREAKPRPESRLEDLVGCTGYQGPVKSLRQMEDGVAAGARRQRGR